MKKLHAIHTSKSWLVSVILMATASILFFYSGYALAAAPGIGEVAKNITENMGNLAKLITAGSYVAGFGFAVGAILKFKAHKDNPTQIPVGTPIALVFIAAALIFLPTIFGVAGQSMFKGSGQVGGVQGVDSFDK